MQLDPALFRHEFARLTAALTRMLGMHNLPLAEDIAQETLAGAVEVWSYRGEVPAHYSAALMRAAKNRAIDAYRRQRTANKHAPELQRVADDDQQQTTEMLDPSLPLAFADDELRMMFTCCHDGLDEEQQVALILSLACGFSATEIAHAFLVSHAAMEKRITRGKKVLAGSKALFDLTAGDFAPRLAAVQRALYLLFSEGYHGACSEGAVRADLCAEAIRLVRLLVDHAPAATPSTRALAALFYLCAARMRDRFDAAGDLTQWSDREPNRWDRKLVAAGLAELEVASFAGAASQYHLEAGIAALHACAPSTEQTPWRDIVVLYDALFELQPTPVVALNRAIAVGHALGPAAGLAAMEHIVNRESLARYPFYPAAIGDLELRRGNRERARELFQLARSQARNDEERALLDKRIASCADT